MDNDVLRVVRQAWLIRIATNAYVDTWRRPAPVPMELPEPVAEPAADPAEVRDALAEVSVLLPPQELRPGPAGGTVPGRRGQ